MVKVVIKAYSPNDPYLRVWAVYINRKPTRYPFTDADIVRYLWSGSQMEFEYPFKFGDYFYFVITSPPEMSYTVTIIVNEKEYKYDRVNREEFAKFEFKDIGMLPWWLILLIFGVLGGLTIYVAKKAK